MKTDRWTVCPKCTRNDEARADKMDAAVKAVYGEVTAEAYLDALKQAQEFRKTLDEPEETLREDFEIGIQDSEFSTSYRAHCDKCGFSHAFKFNEPVAQ